jgi:hypothetical protein
MAETRDPDDRQGNHDDGEAERASEGQFLRPANFNLPDDVDRDDQN